MPCAESIHMPSPCFDWKNQDFTLSLIKNNHVNMFKSPFSPPLPCVSLRQGWFMFIGAELSTDLFYADELHRGSSYQPEAAHFQAVFLATQLSFPFSPTFVLTSTCSESLATSQAVILGLCQRGHDGQQKDNPSTERGVYCTFTASVFLSPHNFCQAF